MQMFMQEIKIECEQCGSKDITDKPLEVDMNDNRYTMEELSKLKHPLCLKDSTLSVHNLTCNACGNKKTYIKFNS